MSRNRKILYAVISLIVLVGTIMVVGTMSKEPAKAKELSYSQLRSDMRAGEISAIELHPIEFKVVATKKDTDYSVTVPGSAGTEEISYLADCRDADGDAIPGCKPVKDVDIVISSDVGLGVWINAGSTFLIIAFLGIIWYTYFRKVASGGGKQPQEIKASKDRPISFSDVAGCEEAIIELQDIKAFLEHPERFSAVGARAPKGVLLYGPPGTGKTLLARALASEAGVPFYSANGSEFVEMYVGVGASRIRGLFRQARKHNGPAIIFFDELDAVGRKRTTDGGDGGSREFEGTLNALLTEMDGFEPSKHPIVIIGATNRLDSLDPALVRPGRFDRRIAVDAPDRAGRERILNIHAQKVMLASDTNLQDIARQTAGMTGADLANLINEAAVLTAREGRKQVTQKDLESAIFRVVAGAERSHRRLSDHERRIVAVHEAGHALVGELLEAGTSRVEKISIIPRGQSGGQTITTPEEDIALWTEDILRNRLAMLLAGRAAEEITQGSPTSGAEGDLAEASRIARHMLGRYGFSRKTGLLIDNDISSEANKRREEEARELLDWEYARALGLLQEHEDLLLAVTDKLLEVETINRSQFLALISQSSAATVVASTKSKTAEI